MTNRMFSIGRRIYLSLEKNTSVKQIDGVNFYRTLNSNAGSLLLEVAK